MACNGYRIVKGWAKPCTCLECSRRMLQEERGANAILAADLSARAQACMDLDQARQDAEAKCKRQLSTQRTKAKLVRKSLETRIAGLLAHVEAQSRHILSQSKRIMDLELCDKCGARLINGTCPDIGLEGHD